MEHPETHGVALLCQKSSGHRFVEGGRDVQPEAMGGVPIELENVNFVAMYG